MYEHFYIPYLCKDIHEFITNRQIYRHVNLRIHVHINIYIRSHIPKYIYKHIFILAGA